MPIDHAVRLHYIYIGCTAAAAATDQQLTACSKQAAARLVAAGMREGVKRTKDDIFGSRTAAAAKSSPARLSSRAAEWSGYVYI